MPSADAFNVGRFAPQPTGPDGEWRDLSHLPLPQRHALLDCVVVGERLLLYGNWFEWSPGHLRPREVEALRGDGDATADAYTASVHGEGFCPVGPSAVSRLLAEAARCGGAAADLLADMALPSWVEAGKVARGQAFLRANLPAISLTLLHLSLLGGYGAPHINCVLASSGKLSGSRDVAYRRLLNTLRLVLDCAGEAALEQGGVGWRSVLGVRLLHSRVRVSLLGRRWDTASHGLPINQADSLVTQLAFSVVVLMGLERAGLAWHVEAEEAEAFLHLWRLIGHLMGVRPPPPYDWAGQAASSVRGSQALLESLVCHSVCPDATARPLVLGTLRAVAYRVPMPLSPRTHVAICRALAGEAYATALGIPALDDAQLDEPITDDRPTTAFTVELSWIGACAHPEVAADAGRSPDQPAPPKDVLRRALGACVRAALSFVRLLLPPERDPGLRALAPLFLFPYLLSLPGMGRLLGSLNLHAMHRMLDARLGPREDGGGEARPSPPSFPSKR